MTIMRISNAVAARIATRSIQPTALPGMSEVLAELAPLPRATLFLGLCEDGLPLLLSLRNRQAGSILILSESASANERLLSGLLKAVQMLNSPEEVQTALVSASPEQYEIVSEAPGRASLAELIWSHVDEAERRLYGGPSHASRLLVLHGLESLLLHLDAEMMHQLDWLTLQGPRTGVWVVASFDLSQVRYLDDQLMRSFGTYLVGPILSPQLSGFLAGLAPDAASGLVPGQQYLAVQNGHSLEFWLPPPE